MTTSATAVRPPAPRRVARRFVPPQHGAWAMLLLPFACGVLIVGFGWPHLPLLGAWLSGYAASYYALQAVKVRRLRRFRPQLALYGGVAVALCLVVVAARPETLGYAPIYALLLAANAGYARRRRDRALANDLVSVLGSCLMVFVVATVADARLGEVAVAFASLLLYFTGTVIHVKTMIRERGSAGFRRASVAYHVLALGVAASLSLPLGLVFALLLARAIAVPMLPLTPKHVGIAEIVASVLLLGAVLAT